MARYIDSVCKLCRREGEKLFLKGSRCFSEKCAFERRNYAPGQHGILKKKSGSEYLSQLREKQKTKRIYGILETQFKNNFYKALRKKGITGENLLQRLECRLDNLVFRMGFAHSRKMARQLVRHSHFLVNQKKVNIPSFLVSVGDQIAVREKSRKMEILHSSLKDHTNELPWISVDKANMQGSLVSLPKREEIPTNVQEQLIVELYKK